VKKFPTWLALFLLAPSLALQAEPVTQVQVAQGTLTGSNSPHGSQIAVFRGIGYAKPPLGELRWRPPLPPVSWQGRREADKSGAPCWQPITAAETSLYSRGLMDVSNTIIGAAHDNIQHDSAVKHVTGEAIYIDDMPVLPDTLEIVLVISPHAHANILSVDGSAAAEESGVAAVLTAADIPGHNDIAPIFEGEPVLAEVVAEYVGHPIAVVAADTYDQAFWAAKLVIVEYEELEPVLAIREALEKDMPTILTLHKKSRHPLLQDIRRRDDARILEVTPVNRALLPYKIHKLVRETY